MKVAHAFADERLIAQALTHPSWANEHPGTPDNQRMEFLGDAVVQLVVTELLFEGRASWPEGKLSRARASLVRTATFAALAAQLELGPSLRVAKAVVPSAKMLADAFEAVTAAVWLDAGLDGARAFLVPLLGPLIERLDVEEAPVDTRSRLQELAEARRLPLAYRACGQEGPPHAPTFRVEVEVDGVVYGPASGSSKKEAAARVAALALAALARG